MIKKIKRITEKNRIVALLFVLLFFSLILYAKITIKKNNNYSTGELKFHVIDVGQGNSVLLECDNKFALIDGGDTGSGSKIVEYMQSVGVKKLDYLIATHYDKDHIYGLISVLYNFKIDQILAPDYVADTKIYKSFMNIKKIKNIKCRQPQVNEVIKLGKATLTCVCPIDNEYQNENDYSLGFKIEYGDNSILACGDATYRSEIDMIASGMNLESDVLFVSHHGSSSSTTSEYLEYVKPKIAIISCGKDNDYGHPTKKVLKRLKNANATIYRTDLLGNILITCDGKNLDVTYGENDNTSYVKENVKYILNLNTKKFHKPACESVKDISAANSMNSYSEREDIIKLGYAPCGRCKP